MEVAFTITSPPIITLEPTPRIDINALLNGNRFVVHRGWRVPGYALAGV